MLEEEAKKRMSIGRPKEGVEKIPQDTGKTAVQAGKMFGVKNLFHFQF